MKSKGQTCEDILERHFFVQQGNRRCAPETLKQAKTFPCSTNQANDPLNLVHDHFKKNTCVHLCLQGNKKMIMPQKAQIQIALLDTPVTHEKQSHPEPQEIVCFNPDEIRETNVKFPSLCNLPGPAFPLYPLLSVFAAKICTSS